MPDGGKVLCVSQARMGSSRLPGKVLTPVAGKPLLGHHLERLGRAAGIDKLVLATSTLAADDAIADYCAAIGVTCYRGSADDVVGRFALCVQAEDPAYVLRVTADCPLIDPALVDLLIARMHGDPAADLYSLTPPRFPRGLDAEIIARPAFERLVAAASSRYAREHVTAYLHGRPDQFTIRYMPSDGDYGGDRWVVDYPEDLALIEAMLTALLPANPNFGWHDCLALLQARPELRQLNAAQVARYAEDVAADQARAARGL